MYIMTSLLTNKICFFRNHFNLFLGNWLLRFPDVWHISHFSQFFIPAKISKVKSWDVSIRVCTVVFFNRGPTCWACKSWVGNRIVENDYQCDFVLFRYDVVISNRNKNKIISLKNLKVSDLRSCKFGT